jgi:TonB family protein
MGSEAAATHFPDPGLGCSEQRPTASAMPAAPTGDAGGVTNPGVPVNRAACQAANERLADAFLTWSFDSVHKPWYLSLPEWFSRGDRNLPPLEVTSQPVPVPDIWGIYDYRRRSLVSSSAAHAVLMLLLFTSVTQPPLRGVAQGSIHLVIPIDVTPFVPATKPRAPVEGSGVENGSAFAPRFELDQPQAPGPQILAPPVAIEPGLTAASLVLPMPGNPLATVVPPAGPRGRGRAAGAPGGDASEPAEDAVPVYKPGGEVTPPALEFQVDPQYSEQARRQRVQGTVLLSIEVWPDGRAHRIRVQRGLGLGLDEKAVEAVRKWHFLPGTRNGAPVRVSATVEVIFQLF